MKGNVWFRVLAALSVLCLTLVPLAATPSLAAARGPAPPACGATATVVWHPSSESVYPNTTFVMDIVVAVARNGQADGADVKFTWDPAHLAVLDIRPGADFTQEIYKNIGLGSARYASGATLGGRTPHGSISMARVTFQSSGALVAGSQLPFTAAEVACAGFPLAVHTATGHVSVVPSPAFVTGHGWINSPAGAFAADPSLAGKASFGLAAKYPKGASIPTGHTRFHLRSAGLDFKSTAYEWLAVTGAKAQYKGAGRINGAGGYDFMVTVIDGRASGGGGVDKFRIKIWQRAGGVVVYDNEMGASDTADPTTPIGGGSIVIHKN